MKTEPSFAPAPSLSADCFQGDRVGTNMPSRYRQSYLRCLGLAFALFSSIRILTYVPTIWAIQASADSSQYSLWTWATWIGANGTMAAWLYENNGRRFDSASAVSAGNAVMCALTCLAIVYYRL